VYDIGAHNGKWALTWIKNYPNSKVFLFEANSIFNSQLAKIGKVYNVVLSNKSKKVNFYSINGTGDSYFKENSDKYNNVTPVERQTSSLDELVNSENLPLPKIIKVDTQGSELDILLGSRVTIANTLYIIVECRLVTYRNMNSPTVSEVIQFLAQLNFAPFKILEIHENKHGILVEIDIVFKNGVVYEDKQ
jgi:FkbM family methyltransferase